jgi:hypothetical protein
MKPYRKCDVCKIEYRPQREAQSYCSRRCREDAAYTRKLLASGRPQKARKRRLATPLLGSSENEAFYSAEPIPCKSWVSSPIDVLGGQARGRALLDKKTREAILWAEVSAA